MDDLFRLISIEELKQPVNEDSLCSTENPVHRWINHYGGYSPSEIIEKVLLRMPNLEIRDEENLYIKLKDINKITKFLVGLKEDENADKILNFFTKHSETPREIMISIEERISKIPIIGDNCFLMTDNALVYDIPIGKYEKKGYETERGTLIDRVVISRLRKSAY